MPVITKKTASKILTCAAVSAIPMLAARADLPSFPGADGAGAMVTTGGRNGIVYHVTTLDFNEINNNRGTVLGSFSYGLNNANFPAGVPRTIVFDVGGTIWLGQKPAAGVIPVEGWDTQDPISLPANVTVAGQTAPGGINFAGGGLKANGNNSIIRNVNIAPGYGARHFNTATGYADQYVFDAMNISATNVVVDHVSAVFATDETISIDERDFNVTVQYSNISQGQNYPQADAENTGVYTGHALGSLIQPTSNAKISVIHNLYAHLKGRLPRVGTESSKLTIAGVGSLNDFRNNVFYNWLGTGGSSGQPSSNNFVNNFWLAGNGGDDNSGTSITNANGGTSIFSGSNSSGTGVYHTGNLKDTNKDGDALDGAALANGDFGSSLFVGAPFAVPYAGVTDSATAAYNQVLNYAGANWQSRNAIDTRIIAQARNGTGKITAFDDEFHGYNTTGTYVSNNADTEWNKLLNLRSASYAGTSASGNTFTGVGGVGIYARAANFDTDGDGMPNTWEIAHGLSPASASGADGNNGDYESNGYTNVEKYLNELAAFPASTALTFNNNNSNNRFAELGNWTTGVWQPSRYDEAQINNGNSTIDVKGQHARLLKIATSGGNNANLSVTNGWIDVADSILVGPGGTGKITQSGGTVHAKNAVVIGGANNAGTYVLNGGTLATSLLSKGAMGGTFTMSGGKLHADTVAFSLTNSGGTLAPGSDTELQAIAAAAMPDINGFTPAITDAIGNTHVNGQLQLISGNLQIEIRSLLDFDTLTIDNALTLGGDLEVDLLNGYNPGPAVSWKVATASSITGVFDSITPGYTAFTIGGNLYIQTVPEPASLILLGLGALPLLRRRRS